MKFLSCVICCAGTFAVCAPNFTYAQNAPSQQARSSASSAAQIVLAGV